MRRMHKDYIEDIINSILKIQQFTEEMSFEKFAEDDKTIFAVIRALEIIGEASKKIPLSLKNKYPAIPWREIAGMRDKLIHEYFGISVKVLWNTVKEDIPTIKSLFQRILEDIKE
jgi:uncharacterized protein with HEPN domain